MRTWLDLEVFFMLAGVLVGTLGLRVAGDATHPRRWGSAIFWLLLGVALGGGKRLPAEAVGYAVLVMTALVATGRVAAPKFDDAGAVRREARAAQLGNRLLWPVMLVPAIAVGLGFTVLPSQVALGLGCVLATGLALVITRERPPVAAEEGGRLIQMVGWALILPQMLAALGGIFAKAGVGDEVAKLVAVALPMQSPFVAVAAYCAGMALFTIIMGNAFAAFPVMTIGVGLPFIVKLHGGNPAIMGALGMLSGYCGTLVTPMAANFNVVPVRLLELRDDWAVIRAQAPFAAVIFAANVALMYACVYRCK